VKFFEELRMDEITCEMSPKVSRGWDMRSKELYKEWDKG
jgi:hypothetical protein